MANQLTLGRGELHFARFATGTTTAGYERYLGNSPEFSATIETETLDHFDSDHGINEKDESVPLSTNRTGSFITDNIDPENVALFFFGEKFVFTVASATGKVQTSPLVKQGYAVQLGMTDLNPTGDRSVSNVVVVDADTPATTYNLNTDYTLNAELGRVTPVVGGGIADDTNLQITYDVAAHSRSRVISGSQAVSGALRYIAFNPVGPQQDWYMPYVKLSPNGDYNLKGDEWQQIPFSIEILKLAGREALYIDGRPYTP